MPRPRSKDHSGCLEPGIDRFAFHREYPEDALMHAAQRLALDEALKACRGMGDGPPLSQGYPRTAVQFALCHRRD
jgi:hypothetical protein